MTSAAKPHVLIADDDAAFRLAMRKALGRLGYPVSEAATGTEAIALLVEERADVALLDLQLGDLDGLTVLRRARPTRTRVIVVTGHGTIPAAVEAMRLGAVSFVQKPIDASDIVPLLDDAALEQRLGADTTGEAPAEADGTFGLVGPSAALERVRAFVRTVAPTDETVLVTGESGVGKELVARALHAVGPRSAMPLVAYNCAQAGNELFDAELFGHVRGAFTGAARNRAGLFRHAHHGTLFLDEVGELPEHAQAKLLRAIDTKAIRPIGSDHEEPVDVRIVAATNRDLAFEVERGRMRRDLWHRLSVLVVSIPPLRERPDDIVPIARTMVAAIGAARGRDVALTQEAEDLLGRYDWPGNVRELANVLKRAVALDTKRAPALDASDVDGAIRASIFGHPAARAANAPAPAARVAEPAAQPPQSSLAEVERRHIVATLARFGGNVTRAADALGIDRRTLQRKLRAKSSD